jgi:hypothetical protein
LQKPLKYTPPKSPAGGLSDKTKGLKSPPAGDLGDEMRLLQLPQSININNNECSAFQKRFETFDQTVGLSVKENKQ